MNEREIFAAAMEKRSEVDRQAFLDEVCDPAMRQRIERLLEDHSQLGSFLDHPPVEAVGCVSEAFHEASDDNSDPTMALGDGSTEDDKAIADEESIRGTLPLQDSGDASERDGRTRPEVPLDYLSPATRDDSLGRLGHYEVMEVVGKGAFGTVLKAFDDKLHRIVAIKVLSPEMAATSPARKRFLREARSSAQVRHENVVQIYAVEDEPTPYLVMEYIPGTTLQQRLDEQGPLDVPDVLRVGRQIADGLAAAHAQELIHRDIKPGNILLETSINDHVKITDFGLARTADDASMTQSGMIAGTPLYMAPEQVEGEKLDQRADLFSFGSVLYQMLSGRPPFRARTTAAVLKRVTDDTPRPIQEIIPEVPDWMCEIIAHLHAKSRAERYVSAGEVSQLLEQCAADIREGRIPKIASPTKPSSSDAFPNTATRLSTDVTRTSRSRLARIAAALIVSLVCLTITEGAGFTNLASTVIRLATGSGTLVIETDDPGLKIAIDGEEVTITGAGVEELTLRPGDYTVAARKGDRLVKQELVSITRNGRAVVRMELERAPPNSARNTANDGQAKSPSPLQTIAPFTDSDVERLAVLPAEEQLAEVRAELKRRNPGFNGTMEHRIENGAVTELAFGTDEVTDISPVRALTKLKSLTCEGPEFGAAGKLTDLRPLHGMKLEILNCKNNPITDLGPLRGMPLTSLVCRKMETSDLTPLLGMRLTHLECGVSGVDDLSPLEGMKLQRLKIDHNPVTSLEPLEGMPLTHLHCAGCVGISDLSPLKGMPLTLLHCSACEGITDLSPLEGMPLTLLKCIDTSVTDLSPLRDLPLKELACTFHPTRDTSVLRSITTLEVINYKAAVEFWQVVDAGSLDE